MCSWAFEVIQHVNISGGVDMIRVLVNTGYGQVQVERQRCCWPYTISLVKPCSSQEFSSNQSQLGITSSDGDNKRQREGRERERVSGEITTVVITTEIHWDHYLGNIGTAHGHREAVKNNHQNLDLRKEALPSYKKERERERERETERKQKEWGCV